MTDEVQRSLGRIEGAQAQILAEMQKLRSDFGDHKNDDQVSFSAVRALVFTQRDELRKQFEENDRSRNQHLNEQDIKLDAIKQDSDRAKGAGWVILSLLAALATFVGGAVIAVLSGWVKIHT